MFDLGISPVLEASDIDDVDRRTFDVCFRDGGVQEIRTHDPHYVRITRSDDGGYRIVPPHWRTR